MKSLTLLFAALAAATPLAADKSDGPTVYLIRHGEKWDDDNMVGLSAVGEARAQCLRKVFGANSQYDIQYIMTQAFKVDGSRIRPFETVTPLAADLAIEVDISCDRDDSKCAKNVVKDYDGAGNILLCWEHDALKDIAEELGGKNVDDYPSDSFDIIWTMPPPYDQIVSITSEECQGLDV